jgi:hypothetical protein
MAKRRRRMREKERRHSGRRRPNPVRRRLAMGAGVTVGATLVMGGTAQPPPSPSTASTTPLTPGTRGCTTQSPRQTRAPNPSNKITFASGLTGSIDLTAA